LAIEDGIAIADWRLAIWIGDWRIWIPIVNPIGSRQWKSAIANRQSVNRHSAIGNRQSADPNRIGW
jgi:hypothetical protein